MRAKFLSGIILAGVLTFVSSAAIAAPEDTNAREAILIDVKTGTVLLDKNSAQRMPTSSMSKVMTLYAVFDALKQGTLKLDDELAVSERAWKMQGSRMFLEIGSKVKVEDLIKGVAIQSGNDATVVLAEGIAGDEQAFVDRLNLKAKELGMENSHFMNASGWPDPEHYSTPKDLSILAERIISDFPEYFHYFSQKDFTYNNIYQPNRLPLLDKVKGADGLKTGHAEEAGYGLIGTAKRDDRRLILVINGLKNSASRTDESVRLMEWGFHNFKDVTVLKKDDKVAAAKVWLGKETEVPLVTAEDVVFSVPVFKKSDITMKLSYSEPVRAPIKKGDGIATLTINVPGQEPKEVTLVAGNDVNPKNIFGKAWARFQYAINKMR